MEVKNCRDCGRLFNYIGGPRLCGNCKAKLEEKFDEVKEFIRANKSATIAVVSEECEVSQKQITQWIREERLEFSEDSSVTLQCETCGAPIRTGRYCNACRNNVKNDFKNAYPTAAAPQQQKAKRDGEKMRFLDK